MLTQIFVSIQTLWSIIVALVIWLLVIVLFAVGFYKKIWPLRRLEMFKDTELNSNKNSSKIHSPPSSAHSQAD